MNHAELRAKVHAYFQDKLTEGLERRRLLGPLTEQEMQRLLQTQDLFRMPNTDLWQLLGRENTRQEIEPFCEAADIPRQYYRENVGAILDEIRKAKLGVIDRLIAYNRSLERYDFTEPQSGPETPSNEAGGAAQGSTLNEAVEAFLTEHERAGGWTAGTVQKRRAMLDLALEWFGRDAKMNGIGKKEAASLKEAVLNLPANRSKVGALRGLTLREAIQVPGIPKINNATVNSYLSTYKVFWAWAEAHGHASEPLFDSVKIKKKSGTSKERLPFTQEALVKTYTALTDPDSKYYSKTSHRWATLIAMFTGARLNEVCQLQLSDITQVDDIWVFDFTDQGDDTKRLKSSAARRRVPVHSHLVELGLFKLIDQRRSLGHARLFPDYTYTAKAGYGDKLSKWFNRTLTPNLGIKSDAHVFHGLRHTFTTRLGQADVETPRIQFIVGHERDGVTHQVYFSEGYSLRQTTDAVERFRVFPDPPIAS